MHTQEQQLHSPVSRDAVLSHNGALLSKTWLLTAGETDAEALMPVTLVATRAIQLATEHANALGIGYSQLAEEHMGWVLARLSIEMIRYPAINEWYTMSTWIEGYNRFFSDRCYELRDCNDEIIGHIRSMWVAIDMKNRTMADLSTLEKSRFPVLDRKCPLPRQRNSVIASDAPATKSAYTFKYCDIDFNRHVNTIRYLDLVLNLYTLDFFDHKRIKRLDAVFEHECLYGENVELLTGRAASGEGETTEIHSADKKQRAVTVNLVFEPR